MSEKKKLYRSSGNRVICGVCGGLGEYFGVSANIFRVLWLLLIPSSIGIWAYFILAILLPVNPGQTAYRRTPPPRNAPPPPRENPLDADARNARDADYEPPRRSGGSDKYDEQQYYRESRKHTGRWN